MGSLSRRSSKTQLVSAIELQDVEVEDNPTFKPNIKVNGKTL